MWRLTDRRLSAYRDPRTVLNEYNAFGIYIEGSATLIDIGKSLGYVLEAQEEISLKANIDVYTEYRRAHPNDILSIPEWFYNIKHEVPDAVYDNVHIADAYNPYVDTRMYVTGC